MAMYDDISLPQEVKDYLEEIFTDSSLCDAFYDCDIEIGDERSIRTLKEDLEELMGPGESSYADIEPFARAGSGATWAVLDGEPIAYIGTEGECGIVSANIRDFMNTVAVWRRYLSDYWNTEVLSSRDSFIEKYNEAETDEADSSAFDGFIDRHGFTGDPNDVYELIIRGMTRRPFFLIKATDDDYTDSYSLLGSDDGQEALESLIERLNM